MIDLVQAKIGMPVFYQRPEMENPEYGRISNLERIPEYVHVKFTGDQWSKACLAIYLYWPPDFRVQAPVKPICESFQEE